MGLTLDILPFDVLLEIFKKLNSVGDVLNLGQTSRCFYSILDGRRLQIMKSVIVR